jgi:hypothetical protein
MEVVSMDRIGPFIGASLGAFIAIKAAVAIIASAAALLARGLEGVIVI